MVAARCYTAGGLSDGEREYFGRTGDFDNSASGDCEGSLRDGLVEGPER